MLTYYLSFLHWIEIYDCWQLLHQITYFTVLVERDLEDVMLDNFIFLLLTFFDLPMDFDGVDSYKFSCELSSKMNSWDREELKLDNEPTDRFIKEWSKSIELVKAWESREAVPLIMALAETGVGGGVDGNDERSSTQNNF